MGKRPRLPTYGRRSCHGCDGWGVDLECRRREYCWKELSNEAPTLIKIDRLKRLEVNADSECQPSRLSLRFGRLAWDGRLQTG